MKPLLSWLIIISSVLSAMWLAWGPVIYGKTIPQLWDIFKLGAERWWTYGGLHTAGIFTAHFVLITWFIGWMLLIKLIPFWFRYRRR
jgi:hypothetical protein